MKKGSRWLEDWKEQRQLEKNKNQKFRFGQQNTQDLRPLCRLAVSVTSTHQDSKP